MRLLACVVLLALVPVASARADGDPASDVLLSQDTFLPYAPPVRSKLKTALEGVLKDARSAGYPMKVALVNTKADLGAYPDLFNQPQRYADLLKGELAVPPEASVKLGKSKASSKRSTTSPLVFALPAVLLFAGLFVAGRLSARRRRDTEPA